jgi:hypothetical protein
MTLPPNLEPKIQSSFLKLLDEIGREEFSLPQFKGLIEAWAEMEIYIEIDRMPVGMTGYGVKLRDRYLVCIRPGLTQIQSLVAKLHELWHIRMGDTEPKPDEPIRPYYNVFIRRRDRHSLVTSRQYTPGHPRYFAMYENPKERTVETLARLTARRILNYERSVPNIVKDIYGY